MKAKNGFTRLELFGITLLIAIIIAIVATILNVLIKARENAFKNSVYGVINGVRLLSASKQLQGETPEVIIHFQNKKPDDPNFKVSGDFPDQGTVHLTKDNQIELKLWSREIGKCIEKTTEQEDIAITDTKENECKMDIENKNK